MRHDGECGFCGSTVRDGFDTCPQCSAIWRKGFTSQGRKKALLILLTTGVLSMLGAATQNSGVGPILQLLSMLAFLTLIVGRLTFLKSWAWFKSF